MFIVTENIVKGLSVESAIEILFSNAISNHINTYCCQSPMRKAPNKK